MKQLPHIGIGIIRRCNMQCERCAAVNDGYIMSRREFFRIVEILQQYQIGSVSIGGGEPTLHPHVVEFARVIREQLKPRSIAMYTNGTVLVPELYHLCSRVRVSIYPGKNEYVKCGLRDFRNVRFENRSVMFDPNIDLNCTEIEAKRLARICPNRGKISIKGTRVYPCCLAMRIEPRLETETKCSVPVEPDCIEQVRLVDLWKICVHCFRANDLLRRKSGRRDKE